MRRVFSAIASMAASASPQREEMPLEDLHGVVWELAETLREQLREKGRQLEGKDRQIRELHVMLQSGQQHLARVMLAQPALQRAAWWEFWSRQSQ